MTAKASIFCGTAGWYVEWFREGLEDDEVAYWYGTRQECEERAKFDPDETWWVHLSDYEEGPPYDAATATGMYDP